MKRINGSVPIRDLELSARGMNALLAEDKLVVVDDVRKLTDYELMRIPNFGKKSLAELREAIGPCVHVPELPPVQSVLVRVNPEVTLQWEPKTGLWMDKIGNAFNLWRINR